MKDGKIGSTGPSGGIVVACMSMTGFGQARVDGLHATIRVEVRTVNHRFVEWNLRLPRELLFLEPDVRALLALHVLRGRGDGFVTLERASESPTAAIVDWNALDSLHNTLLAMEHRYNFQMDRSAAMVQSLQIPDVVRLLRAPLDEEGLSQNVMMAFETAISALVESRQREGERIAADMRQKLVSLQQLADEMVVRAPEMADMQRDRLRERIADIAGVVDEQRMLTELAVMLDRLSIDEEIVRLSSHVREFEDTLGQSGAVGRRLDFLVQELNREVNTIGSKSNHLSMSKLVVDAKVVIEQLREQAQNLE